MLKIKLHSFMITLSSVIIIMLMPDWAFAQDYFKRNVSIKLFNDGVRLEREGNLDRAIETYEKAIDADPTNPFPYLNLGSIEFTKGEYLLARHFYLMSFRNDPSYANAKQNLSLCEKKIAMLNSKEMEDLAGLSFSRGQSLYAEGKPCPASREFMRYAGAYPEKADGYFHLGKALIGCGRYSTAEKNLSLAAQFSGLDSRIAVLIAEACEKTGNIKRALEMYRFVAGSGEITSEGDKMAGSAHEDAESFAAKISTLENRIEQIQSEAQRIESELSQYLSALSDASKSDLHEFIFSRISEGIDEKAIKDEIKKSLKMSLSGLNFDNGLVRITLSPGWYQVMEDMKAGSPFALFRKWPGDSQLALYAVQSVGEGFEAVLETAKKVAVSSGSAVNMQKLISGFSNADKAAWFDSDYAFEEAGIERLKWWIFHNEGNKSFCLAVALPGYAGLQAQEREKTLSEISEALSYMLLNREIWKSEKGVQASQKLQFPLPPEFAGRPPFTEKNDPWRVVPGYGFTILVPPGVIGRKIDSTYPEKRRDSTVLLMRGEFTDSADTAVKIGNEQFPGYIDILEFSTREKSREYALGKPSQAPPAPDKESTLLKSEDFTAIAQETTGADSSSVAKFQGKEFPGKWLVFRMSYETKVVEFGFPVVKGEDSMSLFWIPTTFRLEGMAPAFPPVDAAGKFEISFKRATLSESKGLFGKEGEVLSPDMRIEVPSGWRVSVNYRSADGYPISLREEKGRSMIRIFRIEQGRDMAFSKKRAQDLICGNCELSWIALENPKRQGAKKSLQAAIDVKEEDFSGSRGAQIYETQDGDLFVIFIELSDDGWDSYSGQAMKRALSSLSFD